jgi:hypothetical protein
MPAETAVVVLLAGGRGTRLGRDKPTLRLGGETLLGRHLRQAALAAERPRFVIIANPGNIDAIRREAAAADADAEVIVQDGTDAHAAAHTGLCHVAGADPVFLAGITDLVPDDTYRRLATMNTTAHLRITTSPLRKAFIGGMLDLAPRGSYVRKIIERPPGGCPPGAPANIWIHYIGRPGTLSALTRATGELGDYENAVNHVIARGTTAIALAVPLVRRH